MRSRDEAPKSKASSFSRKSMAFLYMFVYTSLNILLMLSVVSAERIYTNEFAVQLNLDDEQASQLAKKHGFVNKGQIGNLEGFYLFEHHALEKRSLDASHVHHSKLKEDSDILWFEQQHVKRRMKRDFSKQLSHHQYPDPLYKDQWFYHGGGQGGFDMNVLPAWKEGYTGKGVVVTILDDGIQRNHPDLEQNYDKLASLDINGEDDDPTPQDNGDNKHGTRCAGEVAAVAYNEFCGIGIAYNASIGGVRMLDGSVTDVTEAKALSHNPNHIHIYSASWGPEDDGQTVDGPGHLASIAFEDGIKAGRSGLGSIFVWASGNGGRYGDSCNCDGYTNSIYTLSISSATQAGAMPWYLEQCSSTLATTYSSGTAPKDGSITTVDVDFSYFKDIELDRTPNAARLCTGSHTGTSASAPIAAGICALALEANPNLTWRDMQYLVVLTSRPEPLKSESGWVKNGVNRLVSPKFGYGLMDAAGMARLAKRWKTVPSQSVCEEITDYTERMIPATRRGYVEVSMNTTACRGTRNSVVYLEHVQVKVTLFFKPRGNLQIVLMSPSGTPSTLLLPRPHDKHNALFTDWPFMSVHFWGEPAAGMWRLFIKNKGAIPVSQPGRLMDWTLIFYGTRTPTIAAELSKRPESRSYKTPIDVGNVTVEKCMADRNFYTEISGKSYCLDKCEVGQYGDTRDFICRSCDKSCLSCFGPSYDNCLSCPKKLFLSKNFCLKSCPDGFYADAFESECLPCSASCLTCQNSRDSCLSCSSPMILFNNTCVRACPRNAYLDKSICQNCHPSCRSCYGKSKDNCLECIQGMLVQDDSCVVDCLETKYIDQNNVCRKCPKMCETCKDGYCLKCAHGFKYQSGNCVREDNCQKGWYDQDGSCKPCSKHCALCKGPYDADCIYCHDGFFNFEGHCVEQCPDGFFSKDQECHRCSPKCTSCFYTKKFDICTKCESRFILHNGICMSGCPKGSFQSNEECEYCDESCSRCWGASHTECSSCRSGYYLMNHSCVKTCPEGYFPLDKNAECVPCYHLCKTCSESGPVHCTSCYENASYADGQCIPCLDDEYYDEYSQTCKRCHDKCGRCNGPSAYNCLSCQAPLRLNETNHLCLPCCNKSNELLKCCACSKNLDICIMSVEHPSNSDKESYDSDSLDGSIVQGNDVVLIVLVICCLATIMFIVLFIFLQLRSAGLCVCHNGNDYERVPNNLTARFDADQETISLTHEDADEDDDVYEKA